jgi:diguanylate cyclase (GGDEF)-like protein
VVFSTVGGVGSTFMVKICSQYSRWHAVGRGKLGAFLRTYNLSATAASNDAAGFGVLALGGLTLVEYASDVSLGIDTWLPSHASRYPGRPSPQTSLGFTLLGANLLAFRAHKNWASLLADIFALVLVAFCLVLIGAYIYGALDMYGLDALTLTSPQTLFCFSCLTFLVAARRAEQGHSLAVLVNTGIGSKILRVMMPITVFLPFAQFAVVAYLINSRMLAAPFVYAWAASTGTFLIMCVIMLLASHINALAQRLRDASLTDELTNVYNRRGFYLFGQQAFRQAARASTGISLLYLDLDGLKRANDTAGHAAGSALIKSLASLLVETFRGSDVVGRLGGDEFAVVLLVDHGRALEAVARFDRTVAARNKSDSSVFPLRFTVGLATLDSGSSDSFEDLVAQADAMMYKNRARSSVTEPVGTLR